MIVPSRELRKLFSSKMWMTRRAFNEVLGEFLISLKAADLGEVSSYKDSTVKVAQKLSQSTQLSITDEYESTNIPEDSIAFHRIEGLILADSYYGFSSKQFRQDLISADANPKVISHFIETNSGGGEAWYLDIVAQTMKSLTKPVVAHYENVAASAAIYLTINADRIYAATRNDTIGSIGTMVSFIDVIGMLEKFGAKYVEEYSSHSDMKNKKFNDLLDGKPEQYIKEELDPLAEQFMLEVASARTLKAKLDLSAKPEDRDPVFRGETFDTQKSIEIGLIDGQMLLEDALYEAYKLGFNNKEQATKLNKVFQTINN